MACSPFLHLQSRWSRTFSLSGSAPVVAWPSHSDRSPPLIGTLVITPGPPESSRISSPPADPAQGPFAHVSDTHRSWGLERGRRWGHRSASHDTCHLQPLHRVRLCTLPRCIPQQPWETGDATHGPLPSFLQEETGPRRGQATTSRKWPSWDLNPTLCHNQTML